MGIGVFLAIAIFWCAFAANASADPLTPDPSPAPAATTAVTDGSVDPEAAAAASETASEVPTPPAAVPAVEEVSPPVTNVAVAGEDNPVQPSGGATMASPSQAIPNSGEPTDRVATAADSNLTAAGVSPGRALDSMNQGLGASTTAAGVADSGIKAATGTLEGTSTGTLDAIRGPVSEQFGSAVSSNLGAAPGSSGGGPQGPSPTASGPAPASPKLTIPAPTRPGTPSAGIGSGPAGSFSVALLPYGAADQSTFSGRPEVTAPTTPQRLPANGPSDATGSIGGSSGGFFFGYAVLLGLLVLAGQAVTRRVRSAVAGWRPLAFVSLLERPG